MNIKGVTNIDYFSKGKRGIIYTGVYKKKKVGIKTKNPDSKATNRIQNEAKFLKLLNKHNIGPRFIKGTKTYVMYEFVEGDLLKDELQTMTKTQLKTLLKKMLKQCYQLDTLGINKEELHRPHKHIILTKKGPVQLDFERCHFSEKMHNVTQFLQFIRSLDTLTISEDKIKRIAKEYLKNLNLRKIALLFEKNTKL
mgnify:CR=1 FL=1|tara:strand:- start:325 stop:912 length:588 start_codon:yes stop_codon:yes gene_type:complete